MTAPSPSPTQDANDSLPGTPKRVELHGGALRVPPASLRAWVTALRPATLTAAAAPVLVGTAISFHSGRVRVLPALATLLGAFLLQIASNFANDVFDYEKGTDTEHRLGPTRAVQAGLVTPRQMKMALALTLGLCVLLRTYLTSVAGWPIVAIGLLSMACAVLYTGGPYPLGYHGLGDLFVMIFFGFVAVCGTTYVHGLTVDPMAPIASAGVGAVITNILVVNNVRDRHGDSESGKKTLAVRFGKRAAIGQYASLYALSYAVPFVLWLCSFTSPIVLLGLVTSPLSVRNTRALGREEGVALNAVLVDTAKLVFLYGASLAAGIYLDAVLAT